MRGKSRAASMVFLAVAFSSLSAAAGRTMRPSSKRWARASYLAYQNYQGPSPPKQRRNRFTITAPYPPAADQPAAIRSIVERFERGERYSILRGCTGTGKTMVMAHTIARLGRPTLVLCHNKTLAAQLARELRSFLRKNHVHLFVSYYNHYVPESYSEASGRYTSKKSSINDELDALRHMATRALVQHEDVVVVASVSCIYGLGMPRSYLDASLTWHADGSTRFESMDDVVDALEANLYENAVDENAQSYTGDLGRGQYELTKESSDAASISLWPPYELFPLRIDLEKVSEAGDICWKVSGIALGNNVGLTPVPDVTIFPAKHHVSDSEDTFNEALRRIQDECTDQAEKLRQDGKSVEADRLQQRVANDLLLLKESGSCPGVENYSRHFNLREAGEAPDTLLDYFGLRNGDGDNGWMLMVDESHVALPQLKAMHGGDRARKEKLVKHGYRLPSAMDNRPLTVEEFWKRAPQTLFVSATPGRREVQLAEGACVDMAIRPTFVPDPVIVVRPPQNQLEDLAKEIRERAAKNERTLALALTKKDAEDLSAYLTKHGIRADYLHSGLKTHDRSKALNALQVGHIDCLVGVNILREGLDLPEVSLVAVLGADVEGFLRSETALLQMIGRAARNINGKAILYANQITKSMKACIDATVQRRSKQLQYNELHGKEMRSTVGSSCLSIFDILKDRIDAEQSQSLVIIAADSGQDASRGSSDSDVKPAISVKKSSRGRLLTDHVPSKPGVYAWKCEKGTTLYIGKAKRLRSRVKSYLAPGAKHSQRIRAMLKRAHRVEFVLTPSERDALVLESSLIKHHQPPYNVLLKDDEAYPFICASIGDPLPSFSLVPRPLTTPQARNYKYFGPYPNIKEINEILAGIESKYDIRSKHFQVRFGDLSPIEYEEDFSRALDEVFLSPSASQQLPTLRSEYEEASKLFQHKHNLERDIVSIARLDDAEALVHVVQLRDGFVAGQYSYSCTLQAGIGCEQDLGSLIQYVLEQKHYPQAGVSQTSSGTRFFPKELLVQYELPDAKNLKALFRGQHYPDEDASLRPQATSREGAKATAKLTIRTPAVRGVRKETDKRALEFALDNAKEAVRQRVLAATEGATQTSLDGTAAKELAELLSLDTIPNRIEAFDISHTKGDVAVGSRIVFEEGKPLKKDYRRFNVRSVDGIDDYASLEEVLNRRFSRAWINGEGGLVSEDDPWCLPDLVVIDGGKGQLSAAMKGMARAGIFASNGSDSSDEESRGSRSASVPVVSLAKNLEEVFAPESSSPINDSPDSAALLLLRSLRDESHRFALANHRKRRSRLSGLK